MLSPTSYLADFHLLTLFLLSTAIFAHGYSLNDERSAAKSSKPTSDCQSCCDNVCGTADCLRTALSLIEHMNAEADPCTDFAEFACGNFYKTASFPKDRSRVTRFSNLYNKNLDVMREIISEKSMPGDCAYETNMKNLYKSCMDEAKIEEIGIEPYLSTEYAREWPTLIGQNWPGESDFNLDKVITRYFRIFIHPFFSYFMRPGLKNSSTYMIYVDNPHLYLPRENYMQPRNDTVLLALETYLRDLAIELGADHAVAAQDAKDVVNLEIELAKITVPREKTRDFFKQYNPTTLAEFAKNYSYVDFANAFREMFCTANILLEDDQEINIKFPSYFKQLQDVINHSDKRRKCTWKSPGDETRNQIDYRMISKRYRNALLLAKTYPSADCYSDHVPMVGKFKLKLKKNSKPFTNIKFDLAILKTNQTIREKYQFSVQNKFEASGDAEEVEQQWENFKSAIMEAATEVIPKVKRKAKQKWMTEEILNLMEERRCAKGNKEKYEQIHKKVQEKCNMSKENWINEKCKEIEQQRKHAPQTMYRNIEEITGKRTFLSTGCIKAMNGDIIIDKEKILESGQNTQENSLKMTEKITTS
ncbi:endothelin-converting enzyme 1 [Plakobranchus ocellatus]|uniref:Endothelin-converting enzyme 1 n=1 Tax=Plakobranchus ocellatus TaxID=259542 RepID=A0AAV4DT23_9GAST|nr:endothelin-converting enzyme 1 [Plakobranchus ocellatus]